MRFTLHEMADVLGKRVQLKIFKELFVQYHWRISRAWFLKGIDGVKASRLPIIQWIATGLFNPHVTKAGFWELQMKTGASETEESAQKGAC